MATKRNSTVVMALVIALVAVSGVWMKKAEAADVCPQIDLEVCMDAAVADVQPSTECCTALAEYTSTNDLTCLCEGVYFTVNTVEYAILIPQKCGLTYKAGIICDGIVIPGGQ